MQDDQLLILRISKLWQPQISGEDLYAATRGWWVTTLGRAGNTRRVLAVAEGEVKEVYEPTRWLVSPNLGEENRVGFEGHIAQDRDIWLGKDVSSHFPKGAANPVRYVGADSLGVHDAEEPGLAERVLPLLEAFESDPLFAMSRAAQELFHSNTLAWLIMHSPELGFAALKALGGVGEARKPVRVWREKGQLDLLVQTQDLATNLVVENKLYSLPSQEQLERYTSKSLPWSAKPDPTGDPSTRYILLSMMEPTFPLPVPWVHVGYHALADALSDASLDQGDDETPLLKRYVGLVKRLAELADAVDPRLSLDEPFSMAALSGELDGRRFDGPLQKMRFTGLIQEVARLVDESLPFDVNITRSKGLATFTSPLSANRRVGWQLQEDQLRLCVLLDDEDLAGKGAGLKQARAAAAAADHAKWFDFTVAEHMLGDMLLPTKGDPTRWNHFDPDFVYRYRKVHPAVSSAKLAQALAALTRRAISWT